MLLMADTGLRPGEACAIQWDDLDGTNCTLRVARSVENSGRVKPIKTDKSRTVDLSARLTSALIAFQASLEADAMVDGLWRIHPPRSATPLRNALGLRFHSHCGQWNCADNCVPK